MCEIFSSAFTATVQMVACTEGLYSVANT
jgi:hypothetical protein